MKVKERPRSVVLLVALSAIQYISLFVFCVFVCHTFYCCFCSNNNWVISFYACVDEFY